MRQFLRDYELAPLRSTLFLAAIVLVTIVLCLIVMIVVAG